MLPKWSRQHNRKACFSLIEKSSAVRRMNNYGHKKTSLRYSWHHINQYAPTTTMRSVREKLCQNRQNRTSNPHRAELEENPLMVDPIKSGTEVDLNYSSLLPLQFNVVNVMHVLILQMVLFVQIVTSKLVAIENDRTINKIEMFDYL